MMFNRNKRKMKIRRFSVVRIIEHLLAMLTVGVLVVTGLAQKFYELDFSQWFILVFGGIDNVRLFHRDAGALFSILTFIHVMIAIFGIIVKRWQPTMIINKKDISDAIHTIRYYIGIENEPARFERYDFKQKFEYWGILVGGFLMILSGLVLWFPMKITHLLPGELIPVSKALHTNEAMLIFIVLALWHIYNAIFSPDVFPLDTSMFTGKISRERMVREHPLELARIEKVTLEEVLRSHFQERYPRNKNASSSEVKSHAPLK